MGKFVNTLSVLLLLSVKSVSSKDNFKQPNDLSQSRHRNFLSRNTWVHYSCHGDNEQLCTKWKNWGWCEKGENKSWMQDTCKESCSVCSKTCTDDYDDCPSQINSHKGGCKGNHEYGLYLRKHCKKSCEQCDNAQPSEPAPCRDTHHNCDTFVELGWCTSGTDDQISHTRTRCQKSCGLCGCIDTSEDCEWFVQVGYCTDGDA